MKKNELNNIGLTSVLKSISLDNPTYYDYFTINGSVDNFLSEQDCLYNDNATTTEVAINKMERKFKSVADYIKEKNIDCDYVTLNINYGIVCEDEFAKKYKKMIELATEKYKSFCDSVDLDDLCKSPILLDAYKNVIESFKRAEEVLNDTLIDYLFSNLISFRLLSVDLNNYIPRYDRKTNSYDFGEYDLVVRENPEKLGDKDALFLVDFSEFISKIKELGYRIETSDSNPIRNYNDYFEGFKNGEYFKVSGDLRLVLNRINNKSNEEH